MFDVFNPDFTMLIEGFDNFTDFEGEYEKGKNVKRIVSMQADLAEQIINTKFIFKWNDSFKAKRSEWDTQLRYFFRYELENLIRLSKLRLIDIYGNFEEGSITNVSTDFITVCKNDILKKG